jgi:hypothetical protein
MPMLRGINRLSWLVLLLSMPWMLIAPLPPGGGTVLAVAFHYVLCYALGVGIARLCGSRRTSRPVARVPEPVRIRRIVLEEVTPYNERTDHAR